ncbi:chemotaxis protein CheW [Candidatus Parabeggiatoa sp. HSG14]|uniref:chemotaxis protein CheW n=1 Tax=Candidatus Parabeggiatoa sp. HSG14 TaxID=3055593 RepID=UPI0025A7530B|nr:chemotaxis protein CheW [Thiotrichales bacterium HSG14]
MERIPLYVLLVFDGRYLFIPQEEVESVEIIADVQITRSSTSVIGWFFGHGNESPVFCLAKDLSLLSEIPKSREYFVLLKNEQQPLGITCDEVENINFKREHLHPQELHPVMRIVGSPVRQLLVYQEKIACVCSGAALVKHLNLQLEPLEQSETT